MNAVIYARYSSSQQSEDSIEAQVRACREYAAQHGLNVLGVYADEAISGKTANRAQYQKMLRDCEKGQFDAVLIHKYDRISRNLGEHVNLEMRLQDMGVTLTAVAQDFGTSNESKILRTLMWSLSEYFLDNLSSEVRKGHRETALKGLHNGGSAPFGYDVVNQHYVVNELEAAYVRRIFDAALNRQGFTAIIAEMDRAGIRGKRNKPIKYPQIHEILRNEKYTGTYSYCPVEGPRRSRTKPDAIRIENALPAIISRAKFEEVQRIMDEKQQVGKRGNYLCSGLVYCECGSKMRGTTSKAKGHEYRYYSCSAHCGAPAARAEDVERAAYQYLKTLLSEENQTLITDALRQYQAGEGGRMEEFKQALSLRIEEKQHQYKALLANLSSGALPPEIVADIAAEMQAIKEEIAVLEATEPPKDFTVEQIRAWLEALKATPDDKAVRLLISRIEVKQKTVISMESTLTTVLRGSGCGKGQKIMQPS